MVCRSSEVTVTSTSPPGLLALMLPEKHTAITWARAVLVRPRCQEQRHHL
jgi:hypothetical protein